MLAAEETALAYGQLAELLKAGLPLPSALRTLAGEARCGPLQQAFERAAAAMERGATAEEAFRAEEKTLGPMLAGVSGAAEGNGKLPALLGELSRWTLEQQRIRGEIREALRYPLVIVFVASVTFLSFPVYETSQQLFKEMDLGRLPAIIANLWVYDWLLRITSVAGILATLVFVVSGWPLSSHRPLAVWWQRVLIFTPVLRAVARPVALTRFCSSCALLMKAGAPYHRAVTAAGALTGFEPYEGAARDVALRLESGASSESVWADRRLFSDTFQFLVQCGVERGELADAFEESAELNRLDTEGRARLIALFLPPLALIFVGAMVLMVVLLLVIPIGIFDYVR